jgi:hypothetical protein
MENDHRERAEALYYHIAGDALKQAAKAGKKGKDEFCLAQYVCASMIFSALTLEAYINQEYTSHRETAKIDVKQLDVSNKWVMLPLLLGGSKTFKKGEPPFQTFDELISSRNNLLVHFKGGPVGKTTDKQTRQPFSAVVKDFERAKVYFNCIAAMIKKLNELTSSKTSVPGFLNGERYLATMVGLTSSLPIEFN